MLSINVVKKVKSKGPFGHLKNWTGLIVLAPLVQNYNGDGEINLSVFYLLLFLKFSMDRAFSSAT